MPTPAKSQQPKLLDEVRRVLRVHYYSIQTERSYVDWIVQFVRFHHMLSREDLFPPEPGVFPARDPPVGPRSGIPRRHHVDPSVTNKAIKVAVRQASLANL